VASTHVVESTTETVRSGYLDPAAKPVAMIASGDTVRYPNTWTHWGNEATFGMSFADREPLRHRYPHGPYSMLGPVEVSGAEPGDVIECSITTLRTIDWGWNSFPLGVGALPHDVAEPYVHYFRFDDARTTAEFTHGITLPMAPFLGVVAAEPAGDDPAGKDPISAILAGAYGGNLVLRDLGVGSHLFLPVAKPAGRIWNGDVHALQGDGVVDQTAIETAAEDLEVRYGLHKQVPLRGPLGETDVITRADEAASRRDADAYVALFTEDAVLDGTQGRHAGRQALRSGVGPIWAAEGPATLHLTLNPVIEPGPSGDQATVRSVLLIIDPAAPPALRATAAITQELRRAEGAWRITRRTVAPASSHRQDRPAG
jgi:acetamidase/formamidase